MHRNHRLIFTYAIFLPSLFQMNQITHWLDSSNVYGSDEEEAHNLRSFVGGRLRSDTSRVGKELLPVSEERGDCRGQEQCFMAGM